MTVAAKSPKNLSPSSGLIDSANFRKTKMCHRMLHSVCHVKNCPYAHDDSELRRLPNYQKTSLCYNYQKGRCLEQNCKYAHGEQELRQQRQVCPHYLIGKCGGCLHFHPQVGTTECIAAADELLTFHIRVSEILAEVKTRMPMNTFMNRWRQKFGSELKDPLGFHTVQAAIQATVQAADLVDGKVAVNKSVVADHIKQRLVQLSHNPKEDNRYMAEQFQTPDQHRGLLSTPKHNVSLTHLLEQTRHHIVPEWEIPPEGRSLVHQITHGDATNYTCIICNCVAGVPVVTQCGSNQHVFCADCFDSWRLMSLKHSREKVPCPRCATELRREDVQLLSREGGRFAYDYAHIGLQCAFHKSKQKHVTGCVWQGPMKEYVEHLQSCPARQEYLELRSTPCDWEGVVRAQCTLTACPPGVLDEGQEVRILRQGPDMCFVQAKPLGSRGPVGGPGSVEGWAPRQVLRPNAEVIEDWKGDMNSKNHLPLKKGDVLKVLEQHPSGWNYGTIVKKNGPSGWFPATFVKAKTG